MRVLVTGGAGFIGSALIRKIISETDYTVLNVDKLTYAGSLASLADVEDNPRYSFAHADICDHQTMSALFASFKPDMVFNLAAETHVDRSIEDSLSFLNTNVVGAVTLLELALKHYRGLSEEAATRFRFVHVSTDEVFGSADGDELFTEATAYDPSSPYSASKAAADHFVRAWGRTYGLPITITNCSNNYGPYQFPEKLIPLMILKAINGQALPVYGTGENVRDWLHVDDHVNALLLAATKGQAGRTFNIGGDSEVRNIDVVRTICAILDARLPEAAPHDRLISFTTDRPGHDMRYAVDASRIKQELGWKATHDFTQGLEQTVDWYLTNTDWLQKIAETKYQGDRLGLDLTPLKRTSPAEAE